MQEDGGCTTKKYIIPTDLSGQMKITISGKPGSGKSTVARLVAERLGLNHYSLGDMQREVAREKCISMAEL
ncbi:MAG: AAA family ATPase, partial [Candidatus Woesearchaeota archaeon]